MIGGTSHTERLENNSMDHPIVESITESTGIKFKETIMVTGTARPSLTLIRSNLPKNFLLKNVRTTGAIRDRIYFAWLRVYL